MNPAQIIAQMNVTDADTRSSIKRKKQASGHHYCAHLDCFQIYTDKRRLRRHLKNSGHQQSRERVKSNWRHRQAALAQIQQAPVVPVDEMDLAVEMSKLALCQLTALEVLTR